MAIPNLDGMSSEELMEFWKRYHRPSRTDAEALIGDRRKQFTTITSQLASYAANKATATMCRERGNITAATNYETAADNIYNKLPDDLKW